jgi:hypothetical protein
MSMTLVENLLLLTLTPVAICRRYQQHQRYSVPKFAAGVVDTGGKFATSVVDTAVKFVAVVVDTDGKFATWCC